MKHRFFTLTVIVAMALGLTLVAYDPPEAARPDLSGTLNLLCTPQIEWCEGMKAEFQRVYPRVTVEFVRMSSGESLTRLRNEKANPQFDIWWGGPIDSFIAAKQEGLLESYDSPNLANLIDPKLMKDPDNHWAGIYVGSLGFASNKNFLDKNRLKPPESWDDLLNPAFKGQVVIAHPASSGTAYTSLVTVLLLKGEERGWEYWKSFNKNVWQYTKSGAAPAGHIGQGEAAVGVVFSHDIVAQMEKGFPIVLSFAREGMGWEIGGMGIVKGAKHPELAKAWFDWALLPSTQELGPKYKAYQAPTVKGAKASRPELLQVKLIDYDFDYAGKNKKAFIEKFTNEITAAPK
jgi:iron(III) transport system substrate-binding protein